MKSQLKSIRDGDKIYEALMFVCPGCEEFGGSGLHLLAVNTSVKNPSWAWNGDLEKPTLTPSILTRYGNIEGQGNRCHSFLREGVFDFLSDSTHSLSGKKIELPDLYEWAIEIQQPSSEEI